MLILPFPLVYIKKKNVSSDSILLGTFTHFPRPSVNHYRVHVPDREDGAGRVSGTPYMSMFNEH